MKYIDVVCTVYSQLDWKPKTILKSVFLKPDPSATV